MTFGLWGLTQVAATSPCGGVLCAFRGQGRTAVVVPAAEPLGGCELVTEPVSDEKQCIPGQITPSQHSSDVGGLY